MSNIIKLFSDKVRVDTSAGSGLELLCLTDMWRVAGSDSNKRPVDWERFGPGQAFISCVKEQSEYTHFECFRTIRGGDNPGTWAVYEIAVAYAQFLSPAFHIQTIREWRAFKEGQPSAGDQLLVWAREIAQVCKQLAGGHGQALPRGPDHVAPCGAAGTPRMNTFSTQ